jgi:thymidylate synthase (FAD)
MAFKTTGFQEKKMNLLNDIEGDGSVKLDVLDRGYVRLVDYMGGDLSVVNSARVSYAKESKELSPNDIKLIKFLAREDHMSPFRHATVQFECYAPLMVARQW